MTPPRLNRRDFIRAAAVTGGSISLAGIASACGVEDHHHIPTEPVLARGGGAPATRAPLRIPPSTTPTGLVLQAAPGTSSIIPGASTPTWMYNGQFPGPTIVASSGSRATVTFQNGLAGQSSITHWHGLLVDPANDGHPRQVVASGGSYPYDFTVNQRAALDWYHPHPHMTTGEQVYRGLAGALIVRDSVDTGLAGNPLGLPAGGYEIPLIVRDASFDSRGNFQFSNKSSGFWGNTPLVNGTFAPYLDVSRGVYRFRLLNGCNARVLRLALTGGAMFTLIGNDGGLLDQVYPLSELTAAPGERFDLLVDFRSLGAGGTIMLRDLDAKWDILEFRGTGASGAGTLPTGALSTIPPLTAPTTPPRRFTFDGMTRINGKVYDISATEFSVPFDVTERWVFVTNGNGPHPVHVHGVVFQVQSRTGGRGTIYPWERGWKDTVLVNDGETVEVLIRFTAHRGLYVMHCHQLAHEDAGMMANFTVE
jgi:blue copper oxidase